MTQIDITWEQVKELIPKRTSLRYVDYRDSLDEHIDLIDECIKAGNDEALYEKSWEWFNEQEWDSVQNYIKELKSDIENKFDIEDAEDIIEEFRESIEDTLRGNDDSDVVEDLWCNTSNQTMFYDTGYEVESESWRWDEKRMNKEIRDIKKYIGISRNIKTWDEALNLMIRQASYGGQLVVYFYEPAQNFIETDWVKTIQFKNFHLAIINTGNGSGNDTFLAGASISLPFLKERLYLCKTINYSYTFSVCGMSSNWCEETQVQFSKKELKKFKLEESKLARTQAKEAEYVATFKAGGCTFGDMNITRHRNTPYRNEFPCGNKCSSCGTFFID